MRLIIIMLAKNKYIKIPITKNKHWTEGKGDGCFITHLPIILEGSNDRIVVILRLFRGLIVEATRSEFFFLAEDFHLQPLEALMDLMVPPVIDHDSSAERRINGHDLDDEATMLLIEADHIAHIVDKFFAHWILSPFWF